jgi:hypothetical protein
MTGHFVANIKNTWLRRLALIGYLPLGVIYNILWHYPKFTIEQAYWFARMAWVRRPVEAD